MERRPINPSSWSVKLGFDQAQLILEAVLAPADMTLANIVRLNAYTTDIDELFEHFPRITDRFGNDNRFATSLLGVAQLPGQLLVMLEATAAD